MVLMVDACKNIGKFSKKIMKQKTKMKTARKVLKQNTKNWQVWKQGGIWMNVTKWLGANKGMWVVMIIITIFMLVYLLTKTIITSTCIKMLVNHWWNCSSKVTKTSLIQQAEQKKVDSFKKEGKEEIVLELKGDQEGYSSWKKENQANEVRTRLTVRTTVVKVKSILEKSLIIISWLKIILNLLTPHQIISPDTSLVCPELGYFGACTDLCLSQFNPYELNLIYYSNSCYLVVFFIYKYISIKRDNWTEIRKLKWILGLILGTSLFLTREIHIALARSKGSSLIEVLTKEQIVSPFFDCDSRIIEIETTTDLEREWINYLNSCQYLYPRCRVKRPKFMSRVMKLNLSINICIIFYCLAVMILILCRLRINSLCTLI